MATTIHHLISQARLTRDARDTALLQAEAKATQDRFERTFSAELRATLTDVHHIANNLTAFTVDDGGEGVRFTLRYRAVAGDTAMWHLNDTRGAGPWRISHLEPHIDEALLLAIGAALDGED